MSEKPYKFARDYQPGRSGRKPGPDKRTMVLNAIRAILPDGPDEVATEQAFYQIVAIRAMKPGDPASGMLMKELMVRLYPQEKSTMPLVDFEFRDNGTAAEKIDDINAAVASGVVPIDVGKMMVDMIVAGIKVYEVTELAERMERIEELLASGKE